MDGTTIDGAEDLDMSMYSLLEYSSNYSDTPGGLWFYSKMKQIIWIILLQTQAILNLSSIN